MSGLNEKDIFPKKQDYTYTCGQICVSFTYDGIVKLNGLVLGKEAPERSILSRRNQTARLIIRALQRQNAEADRTEPAGFGRMSDYELFDTKSIQMDSPRLKEIKSYDIQTHYAKDCEEPWMAIPMKAARIKAGGYLEGVENDIASVTASAGVLLEDAGLVFFGLSQREVEDEALYFCRLHNTQESWGDEFYEECEKSGFDPLDEGR